MKQPRTSLVALAATALSDDAEHAPKASDEARARAIAAMGAAVRQQQRRRRAGWATAIGVGVAAAAAVALWIGGRTAPAPVAHAAPAPATSSAAAVDTTVATALASDDVRLRRGGNQSALVVGEPLLPGDRVLVGGRAATLGLFRGTRLTLDPSSELVLASGTPAYTFDLGAGAVRADVAKLTKDERFVVRTADAEVEVRGTSFRVVRAEPRASCGGGTTTRVVVFEGTVAVRSKGSETLVHAGESWPAGCDEAAPPVPTAAAPAKVAAPAAPSPRPSEIAPVPAAPIASSDLAAQNDMFLRALAQRRAGDAASAVTTLDELLALHPSTTLAQSATAERMKILYGIDPARGREAARDYLERYPNGFARSDANVILQNP